MHRCLLLAALPGALASSLPTRQTSSSSAPPTVFFPLNLKYGFNNKVSTTLSMPWSNTSIDIVFDQGSDSFWMFGPDSIANWGCTALGCRGPCNETVQGIYDYPSSPTATGPAAFSSFYSYGGFSKLVYSSISVNDTFTFVNPAGLSSTVPDLRVSVADFMIQRLGDNGTCVGGFAYDKAIMGIAPFQHDSPTWNTTGPSVRQDLLDRGVIEAPVQCMWFDQHPDSPYGTYTGGGLFGGIDTSKYVGDLVKVPLERAPGGGASVGYYVPLPRVSVNGTSMAQDGINAQNCLVDSGTQNDDIPVPWSFGGDSEFYKALGLTTSPIGHLAWPGKCESIPKDLTIDLTFDGVEKGKEVTIKVPLKNYVHSNADAEDGYCALSGLDSGGCLFGGPFATSAFFAADDERGEIAFAQGGVSAPGEGVDSSKVVARIP